MLVLVPRCRGVREQTGQGKASGSGIELEITIAALRTWAQDKISITTLAFTHVSLAAWMTISRLLPKLPMRSPNSLHRRSDVTLSCSYLITQYLISYSRDVRHRVTLCCWSGLLCHGPWGASICVICQTKSLTSPHLSCTFCCWLARRTRRVFPIIIIIIIP